MNQWKFHNVLAFFTLITIQSSKTHTKKTSSITFGIRWNKTKFCNVFLCRFTQNARGGGGVLYFQCVIFREPILVVIKIFKMFSHLLCIYFCLCTHVCKKHDFYTHVFFFKNLNTTSGFASGHYYLLIDCRSAFHVQNET